MAQLKDKEAVREFLKLLIENIPPSGAAFGNGVSRFPPGLQCHSYPYGRGKPCAGMCLKEIPGGENKEAAENRPDCGSASFECGFCSLR